VEKTLDWPPSSKVGDESRKKPQVWEGVHGLAGVGEFLAEGMAEGVLAALGSSLS